MLSEVDARRLLGARGIPFNRAELATHEDELDDILADMPMPIVMKVASPKIVHKSDSGCVLVGLRTADEARAGFAKIMTIAKTLVRADEIHGVSVQEMVTGVAEIIVGAKQTEVFGPIVMLGMGGVLVELVEDVALRLCPVSETAALAMLDELKTRVLLRGYRGRPSADIPALARLVARVSRVAADDPDLAEIDLNPVIVRENGAGVVAVDARVRLVTRGGG